MLGFTDAPLIASIVLFVVVFAIIVFEVVVWICDRIKKKELDKKYWKCMKIMFEENMRLKREFENNPKYTKKDLDILLTKLKEL